MGNESILLFVVETVQCRSCGHVQARKKFSFSIRWASPKEIIAVLVSLIIIYLIYGALTSGVIEISSTSSLSFASNQTSFIRIYNGSDAAIKLSSTSSSSASFLITSLPALYGPVVSFSMAPGSSLNVSTDGSHVADMNIRLVSSTSAGATVAITPFLLELGIKPSASITLLNPASLSNIKTGSSLTTVTTVSTQTTTVLAQNQTQILFQQALQLMNKTGPGALMKDYKALYEKDVGCTMSTYNSTYAVYYSGAKPPAPVSFENVSSSTPTDIKLNLTTLAAKDNVLLTYSTVSPSPSTTGSALIAIINTSSAAFLHSVTYTGLYTGLNYSALNSSYSFQSRILNDCGAYISPP